MRMSNSSRKKGKAFLPTANVIVAGLSGVGKTSLISAILGEGFSKNDIAWGIRECRGADLPIRFWDTVGLDHDAETAKWLIQNLEDQIEKMSVLGNHSDRPDAIWYCVNSKSGSYQEADIDFIQRLGMVGVPVIIVLSQCDGEADVFEQEVRKVNREKELYLEDVVQVGTQDLRGVDKVIGLTIENLSGRMRGEASSVQDMDKMDKRKDSERIIIRYIECVKKASAKKGLLKIISGVDEQTAKMFEEIGSLYRTQIPERIIQEIAARCHSDFNSAYSSYVKATDSSCNRNVKTLLNKKKREKGFSGRPGKVIGTDRAAMMVAFFGYTFVDLLEKQREVFTRSQLNDIGAVCNELGAKIKQRMMEKRLAFAS